MSWLILPGDKGLLVPEGTPFRMSALDIPALSLTGVFSGDQFVTVPRPMISYQRLTNPNRTDVLDGAGQWLATFTDGSRTVRMRRAARTFIEQVAVTGSIQDMFQRVVFDGWGNTVGSGKWVPRLGTLSDFSVTGRGFVNVGAINSHRRITLPNQGYTYPYVNAAVIVSSDKLSAGTPGAAQELSLIAGYVDDNNHYLATILFGPTGNVSDLFQRGALTGWGLADTGQSWLPAGGVQTDYSVNGAGQHHLNSVSVPRRCLVAMSSGNQEIVSGVYMPATPAGGSVWGGWVLRYYDSLFHYSVRIRRPPSGNAELSLHRMVNGVNTDLGVFDLGQPHIPGQGGVWYVRARIQGTSIKVKSWPGDIMAEPGPWQIEVTDTQISTGTSAGASSVLASNYTGSFPYDVFYERMEVTNLDAVQNPITLALQKRQGGVTTTLDWMPLIGVNRTTATRIAIHLQIADGWVRATAYPTIASSIKPSDVVAWNLNVADTAFLNGDVGVNANLAGQYTGTLPVKAIFESFAVDTQWLDPPQVSHSTWVYIAPTPFVATAFPLDWFYERLYYGEPDVLANAMGYISNAAIGFVRTTQSDFRNAPDIGRTAMHRWSGDAEYGPLDGQGARVSGADFNDYIAQTATYANPTGAPTTDAPETPEVVSLDASGYLRTVYGLRGKMALQLGTTWTDGRIPLNPADIALLGPGIVVVSKSSAFLAADLARIQIGDVVAFAATEPPNTGIDHIGIYIGTDSTGTMRFVSSRKTSNGPTFADVEQTSKLQGTGIYALNLRYVRRF